MFKYTVKYEDYNGENREKDLFFNLSVPEMINLENSTPGGYSKYIERIAKEKNAAEVWNTFEELVDLAYGEKSPDGDRFVKVGEDGSRLVDKFKETSAFEAFMFDILSNADLASNMVNNMIPNQYIKRMQNGEAANVVKLESSNE